MELNPSSLQGVSPSASKVAALTTAASVGNLDTIARYDGDVNAKDHDGYTPLHKAIVCGQHAAVKALLAVDELDVELESCGFTPLYAAAINNGTRRRGRRGSVVVAVAVMTVGHA